MPVVQRVWVYIKDLRAIPRKDKKRIWSRTMAEMKYLGQYYKKRYIRTSLSTVYRPTVRQELGSRHPALPLLHISDEMQKLIKTSYNQQIYARHQKIETIDAEAFIATAKSLLQRDDYMAVALGLLLLTGRRPQEVFVTGTFERIPRDRDNIRFGGQAKTRGSRNAQLAPYTIPILNRDPKAIINAVAFVRASRTTVNANKELGTQINDYVYTFYAPAYAATMEGIGNVHRSSKELRKIYAAIAYSELSKWDVSMDAYYARILGHSGTELQTVQSYKGYVVLGRTDEMRTAMVKSETETLADLALLESLQPDLRRRRLVATRVEQQRILLGRRAPRAPRVTAPSDPALATSKERVREALRLLTPASQALLMSLAAKKKTRLAPGMRVSKPLARLAQSAFVEVSETASAGFIVEPTPLGRALAAHLIATAKELARAVSLTP